MRVENKILLSVILASTLYAKGQYNATIIDNAECAPINVNDKPSGGMKDNRRVDVTMQTTQQQPKDITVDVVTNTKAYIDGGGVIWSTSDPLVSEPHLQIKADTLYLKDRDVLKFFTYNNYSDYIDRFELVIYNGDDKNHLTPIKTLSGKGLPSEIVWDIKKDKVNISAKNSILYALRVSDKDNHKDESTYKKLLIKETEKTRWFC